MGTVILTLAGASLLTLTILAVRECRRLDDLCAAWRLYAHNLYKCHHTIPGLFPVFWPDVDDMPIDLYNDVKQNGCLDDSINSFK